MNPMHLGNVFYHIEVVGDLSDDVIMLWADSADVCQDGSLKFTNHTPDGAHTFTGFIIPPGCWKVVYAAMPAGMEVIPLVTTHWCW